LVGNPNWEAAVIREEPRFYAILRMAERDPRLPERVRRAVVALRAANDEFGRWGAEVKRGERPGNLEEAIWPVLDRDDEVIRTWELFNAAPDDASVSLFAAAVEHAKRERMRLTH
jgi:hypothetical protein